MRFVRLQQIDGNEILARPILDLAGRVLLSKGVQLKLGYLNKLDTLGVSGVYIEDKISEGIEVEDVISEETRLKSQLVIQKEMDRFLKNKKIDTLVIRKVVNNIIQDILSKKHLLLNLSDIGTKDNYTFAHSVNVCVLSILLSIKLGFNFERIKSIATGCLLHDFGKMLLPNEILNKPGQLTAEEYAEIKKHPLYGYQALKDDVTLDAIAKVTILMHHERVDGLGYPHGISGEKIHEAAKICGVCDSFDALTSDRIYRKAWSICDAVEYMYSMSGTQYDKRIVDEFLRFVAIYPEGTVVLLNTNIIAIVVKNNHHNILRPIVRFLYNIKTRIKYIHYEVDMMKDLTLKIEKPVELNLKKIQDV